MFYFQNFYHAFDSLLTLLNMVKVLIFKICPSLAQFTMKIGQKEKSTALKRFGLLL